MFLLANCACAALGLAGVYLAYRASARGYGKLAVASGMAIWIIAAVTLGALPHIL